MPKDHIERPFSIIVAILMAIAMIGGMGLQPAQAQVQARNRTYSWKEEADGRQMDESGSDVLEVSLSQLWRQTTLIGLGDTLTAFDSSPRSMKAILITADASIKDLSQAPGFEGEITNTAEMDSKSNRAQAKKMERQAFDATVRFDMHASIKAPGCQTPAVAAPFLFLGRSSHRSVAGWPSVRTRAGSTTARELGLGATVPGQAVFAQGPQL
jgi:hypothetical protein